MELGLLAVFALVLFISFLLLRKHPNLPPGRFNIPYVGTLGLLWKVRGRRPHEVFLEEAKTNNWPIFRFSIGKMQCVALNSFDTIHEAFVKNADVCSGRVDDFRKYMNIKSANEGIVFSTYGESWRELRRFTIQALRDFGVGKTSLEEKIHAEIDALTVYLKDTNGKPVQFNRPVQKLVANVIFGIVFGTRYDFDDPECDRLLQLTDEFVNGQLFFNYSIFLPEFITKLFKRKGNDVTTKQNVSKQMNQYISDQIDEHEATFDNDNIRDFVDFYWRTVKHGDAKERKHLTKQNMFRVISDLFLAGSETTSVSLDWAILYMTEYPETQKRCQHEIETVVGDRNVVYADRTVLPFCHAAIMEVQRMTALAPLGVPHLAMKDVTINGYDIPKGTGLFGNIWAASYDDKHWDDPYKFNPDRFLTTDGKIKRADAFIPFSTGPRECAGAPLAKMELFLVFCNLLQRFTFAREDDAKKHSLQSIVNRATSAPIPYKLRAYSRS